MGLRAWRIVAIGGLGIALGLLWNGLSGRGFALGQSVFVQRGDEVIEAAEAKTRLDRGALFLDARPVDFYKMGHIPGALPLPEPDFERAFAGLEPRLRRHFNLVVYCSGYGCEASHIVARRLREKGIHAAILNEGWPAWTDAGYPVRSGEGP
ncbi:MAG TPA: rhodanese-like domain-containing protein [Vicinamibacteria bacterium]|nr:rhodanese-like domain-containing protein [Vicinamibacteria bacterium]